MFDEFENRVSICEIAHLLNPSVITAFYGGDPQNHYAEEPKPELHLPLNFALILLEWNAEQVRAFVGAYEGMIPAHGWGNYVVSNHDQTRVATRIGDAQARVAALLLLTLRGMLFIYYGDELGMRDVNIPAEKCRDPQGINLGFSRDPERC